ncbi:MAG TPA: formylglycine-generating enzyme family protein [bacterium]|nr:formylglycine-generating enzyme family protein [bacterium]
MKGILRGLLVMMAVLFVVACGEDGTKEPAMGSKGGDCYGNGTCDGDLVCLSNVCVDPTETPDKDTAVTDTEQPDVDYGTGTPPEMVEVPAGEFQMGCNEAVDNQCGEDDEDDESPYHAVTLSAYQIGKYEVTVSEYQQCVTNGACNNSNENEPHHYTNTDESDCNLGAEEKGNHPMQCVTWYGAKAYCEWIGGRLPTEAEWEKAARGTDGRKYPWGNEDVTCDYAVITEDGCSRDGTMPIGSKEAGKSPYGAYDMAGNVWEMVNDWYAWNYYASSPTDNPAGPETGVVRVLRGGSWYAYSDGFDMRSSYRSYASPDSYGPHYGFRCAK